MPSQAPQPLGTPVSFVCLLPRQLLFPSSPKGTHMVHYSSVARQHLQSVSPHTPETGYRAVSFLEQISPFIIICHGTGFAKWVAEHPPPPRRRGLDMCMQTFQWDRPNTECRAVIRTSSPSTAGQDQLSCLSRIGRR